MVEVNTAQTGFARVVMLDVDGNETTEYDVAGGVTWEVSDSTLVEVVDDDAEPTDVEFRFLAAGGPVTINCTFDGDPGGGVRQIELQSEEITIVEPPVEGAVGGRVEITFNPI